MWFQRNIPNVFTLCNLLTGAVASTLALKGQLEIAFYLLLVAALFDFLDGMTARLLKASSELGKQLDSLADLISFGFLPSAVIFYQLEQITGGVFAYAGFLILVFSALRLAIFNIDTRQTDHFIGLSTPANALFMASVIFWKDTWLEFTSLNEEVFFFVLIPLSCFLLVAPLPLIALKFKDFSISNNLEKYILVGLSAIFALIFKATSVPMIIISYVVLSLIFLRNKPA
jgi:CDP-diacylglycerol--serine O-phosphatidyltransferase